MKSPSVYLSQLREKISMKATKMTDKQTPSPSLAHLGLRLLALIDKPNGVVSPAGVGTALQLAAAGATPLSATHRELIALLGDTNVDLSDTTGALTVATAAYLANASSESFRVRATKELGAHVAPLPATADPINAWVSKTTKQKITTILNTIPPDTTAVLLSAVHFAAKWQKSFDPASTTDDDFHAKSGDVPCRMMNARNINLPYAETTVGTMSVQAVRMPYAGNGGFSALIVLPFPQSSLDELVAALGAPGGFDEWTSLCAALRPTGLGALSMPRFYVTWDGSLVASLRALGLKHAFDGEQGGAFNEIAQGAVISDVVHKACVECTEEGTVAAAATAVIMERSLHVMVKPDFVCDRPFLMAVTKGEELLFVCRVDSIVNPT